MLFIFKSFFLQYCKENAAFLCSRTPIIQNHLCNLDRLIYYSNIALVLFALSLYFLTSIPFFETNHCCYVVSKRAKRWYYFFREKKMFIAENNWEFDPEINVKSTSIIDLICVLGMFFQNVSISVMSNTITTSHMWQVVI